MVLWITINMETCRVVFFKYVIFIFSKYDYYLLIKYCSVIFFIMLANYHLTYKNINYLKKLGYKNILKNISVIIRYYY